MLRTVYENVVFSRSKIRASQKSRVFPFTCHLFLLLEALQGFVRLLEVLDIFGMVLKVLEGFAGFGGFVRLCAVLRGVERLWEVL